MEAKIMSAKKKLQVQVLESEVLCRELESPNQDRLRVLDAGEDPSEEELAAKLATLECLVQHKNEVLLAGEISYNEIASQIQELEEDLQSYKIATQAILQGINENQGRVQEKQRLCTAHIGEIRMYEELIAASKSKISELEHDILLREQLLSANEGENEYVDSSAAMQRKAVKTESKNKGCERPNGYLPGDDDETTIRVPRPYGAQAPFKAGAVKQAESNWNLVPQIVYIVSVQLPCGLPHCIFSEKVMTKSSACALFPFVPGPRAFGVDVDLAVFETLHQEIIWVLPHCIPRTLLFLFTQTVFWL